MTHNLSNSLLHAVLTLSAAQTHTGLDSSQRISGNYQLLGYKAYFLTWLENGYWQSEGENWLQRGIQWFSGNLLVIALVVDTLYPVVCMENTNLTADYIMSRRTQNVQLQSKSFTF